MATKKSVDSIKVRMYRHGFGDCFFISCYHEEDRVFTILIDCGIKLNTGSEDVPIEDVISDLTTLLTPKEGGKPQLDVLVATHGHWDHVAFFHPTTFDDLFGDFEIGQVWLAWTENPNDKEAATINSRLRKGVVALQFAASRLHAAEKEDADQTADMPFGLGLKMAREKFNRQLDDVLGFYGITALKSYSGMTYNPKVKLSIQTQEAMERITKLAKRKGDVKYFLPGTMVDKDFLPPGINVYVLGPPKDKLINQSNPSKRAGKETCLSFDHSGMTSFVDALLGMGPPGAKIVEGQEIGKSSPFGQGVGISKDEAINDNYFESRYFDRHEAYRKIEHSWLDFAHQFALQLAEAMNNTSLVLAIELADSGKVLLFPGDAQAGSWLSWHDHEWKIGKGAKAETRTAEDLLNNTVLYKVSHHGSHNATINEKGLEMMTHADLVAMIPEKENSYNGILSPELFDRLQELCKGRVIVSADVKHPPEDLVKDRPQELSATEWKTFKKNLIVNPLYVEFTVQS